MNLEYWRFDDNGRSLAYFSKKNQVSVSLDMLEELQKISEERGKINARFCLHSSPEQKLQDMVVIAYKGRTCKKLHKHVNGQEAIHVIKGKFLALIVDGNGDLVDKRVLDANKEFAYRNEKGRYHIYLPLTDVAVMREIRDAENTPGETVFSDWDSTQVLRKYLPEEILRCENHSCKSPCALYSK